MRFWHDIWCGAQLLKDFFLELFSIVLNKDASVHSCLVVNEEGGGGGGAGGMIFFKFITNKLSMIENSDVWIYCLIICMLIPQ